MENNYFYSVPTGGTTINFESCTTTQDKVNYYENLDRYIAERFVMDNIKEGATNISITPTPIKCSVDLKCSCTLPFETDNYTTSTTCNFNIEIKSMKKTEEQFEKYPDWMLRVEKWKRMKQESNGRSLYYLVLCPTNKTGYLYRVDNMDGIRKETLWMKKCQVDDNSEYYQQEVFQIPIEKAVKIVDISKYYADFEQTQKENNL